MCCAIFLAVVTRMRPWPPAWALPMTGACRRDLSFEAQRENLPALRGFIAQRPVA